MARRYHDLPTLTSLAAFEAAARHLSFKDAASELNVTPGAVSRQIKSLEDEIGHPLFQRIHRGVRLTAPGETLFAELNTSFKRIGQTVKQLRSRDDGTSVTIATTVAFASLWLMPRLGSFWRAHQDVTVNHVISDNMAELRAANADLHLRYGDGSWPGEDTEKLFGDTIFPVCGPKFARSHRPGNLEQLIELPLLQMGGVDASWLDWTDWLDRIGMNSRPKRARSFTNYVIALQAAQDNQGVALGWEHLVSPLLAKGRLVRMGDWEVKAPGAFYITWPNVRPQDSSATALRDWLIMQAKPVLS